MVTRSQRGIVKPIEHLSLYTSYVSPIPKSPFLALNDPNWCNAMYDEYNALVKNSTWILVPRPIDANLVRSMWFFKHKFHVDGTLSRYKARLVTNSSSQQLKVDFDETFSPVVKPATIRTVLSLAVAYLLIYVDDIILTASSLVLLQRIVDSLHKEFDMTDLEALNYFLGISVVRNPTGLFLSQKKYALQLLERAHMANCNPSRTPVDTNSKLGPNGIPVQDPTLYRSLAGGLQYLTFTRPDLSYVVQQGTMELGLHLYASATTSLVGYTDADWASLVGHQDSLGAWRGDVWLGEVLSSSPTQDFYPFRRNRMKYRRVQGTTYCPIGCHCWT
nr:hypothetical protein [Tanacetum cinerariifolium]